MKRFFSMVLAVIVAQILWIFLGFIFLIVIGSIVASAFESDDNEISTAYYSDDDSIILEIPSNLLISEGPSGEDYDIIQGEIKTISLVGLQDIVSALAYARDHDAVRAVSLDLSTYGMSPAQTHTLRQAIKDFRTSGKPVYSYADNYFQGGYILGSAADKMYVHPLGDVFLRGLGVQPLYLKNFFDMIGVEVEVIRMGKYKSAAETFSNDKMTQPTREEYSALINDIWNSFATQMSVDRKIDKSTFNRMVDNLDAFIPEDAVNKGLIDGMLSESDYQQELDEIYEDNERVLIQDYAKYVRQEQNSTSRDRIAVVYAQGEIIDGDIGGDNIINNRLIETLTRLKDRNSVKAVVLRVNSPGGSAMMSDKIWEELEKVKEEKPVVVSMGSYAASGGYYISAGADFIFAEPQTVTGSIGVIFMSLSAEKLRQDVGITDDQVSTHKNANLTALTHPLSKAWTDKIQKRIGGVYDTFLDRVAKGRKMTTEEVHEIAQGRVWSGVRAMQIGLIDSLGGLSDAIKYAAKVAELDEYRVMEYPRHKNEFERLFGSLAKGAGQAVLPTSVRMLDRQISPIFQTMLEIGRPIYQLRMPPQFEIEMK